MPQKLFHVREDREITWFEPRLVPSPDSGVSGLAVWAVAESHLANYLTPRDCPRICFRAGPQTTAADRETFLGCSERVVAFEGVWLERVRTTEFTLYEMPDEVFESALPEAGYWIARCGVSPRTTLTVANPLAALQAAGVETRIIDDFWPLADAVARSTLQFSIIRKRNALQRGG